MKSSLFTIAAVAGILAASTPLLDAANLTLTPAGVSAGFKLTTFATIAPGQSGNTGPFGVVVLSSGNVMVNYYANDTRYVFSDVDGQTTATALRAITPSTSQAGAFAWAGGQAYGPVNVQFVQFNSDGTVNHVLRGVTQTPWFGMWGNPVNGHILSTTGQGQIIDIDPAANGGTGSARVVASPGIGYDGVTVSPDGTIVYVVQTDHITGYNIASGAQVFNSGALAGQPDGLAVISSNNSLNGKIIVNFNGLTVNAGFVGLLDPATKVLTTIASGGTRGDYASPDPSNGSLFLSYSDLVYRLSCGANCSIGLVPPAPVAGAPTITTIAGTGVASYSGDGGPATSAAINFPESVAVDHAGNIYFADLTNFRVRKVDPSGTITTVAGCGQVTTPCALVGLGDGGPATAPFMGPFDVAVDSAGTLYIADDGHQSIRKVDSSGIITTVAGNGKAGFSGDGGPATGAALNGPGGIAFDSAGNLYIADLSNNRIRKVDTAGIITTVAGNGVNGFSGDGGPATSAALANPHAVAVDSAGNLYIADTNNFRVRKVNSAGIITTFAGTGTVGFSGDGGPATSALITGPKGMMLGHHSGHRPRRRHRHMG